MQEEGKCLFLVMHLQSISYLDQINAYCHILLSQSTIPCPCDNFGCSVEPSQRFGIVQQFNQDPSISVMLLTTSVGGLGLNLTAADTVIFMEHDWNPMKDLQVKNKTCTVQLTFEQAKLFLQPEVSC